MWESPSLFQKDGKIIDSLRSLGDTYVDVGINIEHLMIESALKIEAIGRAFAFEAHPRTATFLRKNIQLNHLGNIHIGKCAVGESFGWVHFTDELTDDQNHVINTPEGIALPVIPLDSLLEEVSPTVLKVDVEGFEKFVFQGASRLLERTDFVYFEAWEDLYIKYGYSFSDIRAYLEIKGFSLGAIDVLAGSFRHLEDGFIPKTCLNILGYKNRRSLKERMSWKII